MEARKKGKEHRMKRFRIMPRRRTVLIIAGVVVFLLFCPLLSLVVNLGTWFGEGIGLFLILLGIFLPWVRGVLMKVWTKKAGKILLSVLGGILALGTGFALVLAVLMLSHAFFTPPAGDETVIVLGCRVRGEEPSKSLRRRIDAAEVYLKEHPGAKAILSGGQGDDELISEAEAMKRALVSRGIAEDRLILEEQSTSTEENLVFSAGIIRENGWNERVTVITDSYHQYRAKLMADRAGLQARAYNARTPFFVFPTYFLRDLLGVAAVIVFG